jgi:hypothetical protein
MEKQISVLGVDIAQRMREALQAWIRAYGRERKRGRHKRTRHGLTWVLATSFISDARLTP